MRKNTNPCNVSLDDTIESEEPVNTTMTTTLIRSEDNSNATQESIATKSTFTSEENNKTWYNTNEEYDSWHNAIETMDNYQEWVDPPTTDKSGYEFLISMLCKFICFMLLCTFQTKVTACETFVCAIKYCLKPSSQRLLQYTDGLINLGPGTPRNIVKQVMIVGNFLITFAKAKNLVITNATVNQEGTVVNTHL